MPPPSSAHPGPEWLCSWLQHWEAGNKPGMGCQSSRPLHSTWLPPLSSRGLNTGAEPALSPLWAINANQQGIGGRFQFGSGSLLHNAEEVLKGHVIDLFDSSLANTRQIQTSCQGRGSQANCSSPWGFPCVLCLAGGEPG